MANQTAEKSRSRRMASGRVRSPSTRKARSDRPKLPKKEKRMITAIPLSAYSETEKNILRYMFNVKGRIHNFMAIVDEMPKEGVEFVVKISGAIYSATYGIKVYKAGKLYAIDKELPVSSGDVMTVAVKPIGADDAIVGMTFSCLYEFDPVYVTEVVDEGVS